MPVRKYRSLQEAEDDLWMDPGDPRLPAVIRGLWRRSYQLTPLPGRPGIRKFRNMEEANRDTEAWIDEGIEFMQRRIHPTGDSGAS